MSAGGGLVFKGSGFYITDYGKDGKKSQTPPVKAGETAAEKQGGDAAAAKTESGASSETATPADTKKPAAESKPPAESKSTAPAPKKSKTKE